MTDRECEHCGGPVEYQGRNNRYRPFCEACSKRVADEVVAHSEECTDDSCYVCPPWEAGDEPRHLEVRGP